MTKRYAYLVIREKTPGLLFVLEPASIVNAYSSKKKAEKRVCQAERERVPCFIHQVEVR